MEGELDERDKEFERRIRALRQEQERMRQVYEERAANPHEAKRINELESELQRTKAYYHKRIREIEDKYKFKVNIGANTTKPDVAMPTLQEKQGSKTTFQSKAK